MYSSVKSTAKHTPLWRSKRLVLGVAVLLTMAFVLLHPTTASAAANNCNNAAITLCGYNAGQYRPYNPGESNYTGAGQGDRLRLDLAPGQQLTVNAGDTISLDVSYRSNRDGGNKNIVTWVTLGGSGNPGTNFLASINAPGGKASTSWCFNVVTNQDSAYYNDDWWRAPGGTFICDPDRDPGRACSIFYSLPCRTDSSSYGGAGVGASAVWFQNQNANSLNNGNPRRLTIVTRDVSRQTTFCTRAHVSLTNRSAAGSGFGSLGDENSFDTLARNLGDVKGATEFSQDKCFTIRPAAVQPVSGLCDRFRLAPGDDYGPRLHGQQYNNRNTTTIVQIDRVAPVVRGDANGNGPIQGPSGNGALPHDDARTWNYSPTAQTIRIFIFQIYRQGPGDWRLVPASNAEQNIDCFRAACEGLSVTGDGPENLVVAGGAIYANMAMRNVGPQPLQQPYPGGYQLGFLVILNNDNNNNRQIGLASGLNPGASTGLIGRQYLTNAPDQGTYTVRVYPAYLGHFFLNREPSDVCEVTVRIYKPFEVQLFASSELTPSDEDPEGFGYKTWVNSNSTPDIFVPTTSTAYKQGGQQIASQNGGNYRAGDNPNYELNVDANSAAAYKPPSVQAGDRYCARITSTYTRGLYAIADANDRRATNTPGDSGEKCSRVTNRPYTKTYGASVSAGGDFKLAGGGGCLAPGILGGWFNNRNPLYNYGTSTQYAAISIDKNIGFASAQTSFNRPPIDISFANNVAGSVSNDAYSPKLGGYLGGTACLTEKERPTSAAPLISNNMGTLDGNYTRNGNFTIDGGNIPSTKNVAVYIDGDVYITKNIRYNTGGWSEDKIPSFLLQVRGDIYIDPDVDQLDGQYIALPKADGSGSHIYTCAAGFSPVNKNNLFDTCKNQLTVYGSFVARNVNLMRTYGSLRNEKPQTPPSVTINGSDYSSCTSVSAISPCGKSGSSVFSFANYTVQYNVGNSNPLQNYNLTLNYRNNMGSQGSRGWPPPPVYKYNVQVYVNGAQRVSNWQLPVFGPSTASIGTVPANASITIVWDNNYWIDRNGNVQPGDGPDFSYDPNLQIDSLTLFSSTVAAPPTPLVCSKLPGAKVSTPGTCAAEVFSFSPEMYLSKPPPGSEDGVSCVRPGCYFDAIVNLPPLL